MQAYPPDALEPHDVLPHAQRRARRPSAFARLERARHGRRGGGVAAGIARFVRCDARLVRLLWVLSVPPSFGVTAVGYLALWLLLPIEPSDGSAPAERPA